MTTDQIGAVGVLLAAGAGTRYGAPKVLAQQGKWLQLAVAALVGGGCDEVLVMLGAAIVAVPPPARAIVVTDWAAGLSASLRAGLAAAKAGGAGFAVIHLVDIPDVSAEVVSRVLVATRAAPGGIGRARYGSRPGHPVVVARSHWGELSEVLHGDAGARTFLRARGDVLHVDCSDLAAGIDVDE
ncbi:nucleotidyltransferase family protein [Mycobacterium vicinigordonae]|uniref:NTP transferase domain-containing protein n=1 Tax=Mycobacterium vicinigordonae TaxID=1719132 RepID=A0A7D6E443_9MYCO|nr:NTP transferase domain-containing protein [Mycobacterium vicinigordonae]QLL09221.1 NTP transferase domain-containing protein [Mycobacterium vicinigordonae]